MPKSPVKTSRPVAAARSAQKPARIVLPTSSRIPVVQTKQVTQVANHNRQMPPGPRASVVQRSNKKFGQPGWGQPGSVPDFLNKKVEEEEWVLPGGKKAEAPAGGPKPAPVAGAGGGVWGPVGPAPAGGPAFKPKSQHDLWMEKKVPKAKPAAPIDPLDAIKAEITNWDRQSHSGIKGAMHLSDAQLKELEIWALAEVSRGGYQGAFHIMIGAASAQKQKGQTQFKIIAKNHAKFNGKKPTFHITLK